MPFDMAAVFRTAGSPADFLSERNIKKINSLSKKNEIMGLRLDNMHRDRIIQQIILAVLSERKMLVVNANAHLMVLSQSRPWIRQLFAQADIAFCDGAGVQWATTLLTGRAAHRTTPPEWIGPVLQSLGPKASIFWLGGTAEVVSEAAHRYEERYGVRTAGVQHGFFDMSENSIETLAVVERINQAAPTIILVNMGMPLQERWVWENWNRIRTGVVITAGALVDHAAGRTRRPSRFVAKIGLEWLVRLVREPRRLWRRYLVGLPIFGFYFLRFAMSGQSKKSHGDR
jgi:N-acetylglucosaminyldiphosphoundecaprenol N-acetyl-beta-D-mannosaminyltransferase